MLGLVQILREILDYSKNQKFPYSDDIKMEIESLSKTFGINDLTAEIGGVDHLKAIKTNSYTSQALYYELKNIWKKESLLPIRINFSSLNEGEVQVTEQQPLQLPTIQIPQEEVQILVNSFNLSIQDVNSLLQEAVCNAIEDILQPVVDRSVLIALKTTRELVLKDFACDGNIQRFMEAANQIVQNLAGSLALVTCREPLRMSLSGNLRKVIRSACENAGSISGLRLATMREHEENPSLTQQMNDEFEDFLKRHENVFDELSSIVSRDNLELGCKMIKHEVINRALDKVKKDPEIVQSIEKRRKNTLP